MIRDLLLLATLETNSDKTAAWDDQESVNRPWKERCPWVYGNAAPAVPLLQGERD